MGLIMAYVGQNRCRDEIFPIRFQLLRSNACVILPFIIGVKTCHIALNKYSGRQERVPGMPLKTRPGLLHILKGICHQKMGRKWNSGQGLPRNTLLDGCAGMPLTGYGG